jgi:transcriptional regulator with XRE-family HTH domain
MSLGTFIKERRERRGNMTQRELAERARVPLSTIQAIEQEKVSTVRLETARRLALVLGTTTDELAEAAREGQAAGAVA